MVNKDENLTNHTKSMIVNIVLCLVKTDCQWRLLSNDFPPHDTVWSLIQKSGINSAKQAFEKYPSIQKFCGDNGYRKSFEHVVA